MAIGDRGFDHHANNRRIPVEKIKSLEPQGEPFVFQETLFGVHVQDRRIAGHTAAKAIINQPVKIITDGNITKIISWWCELTFDRLYS